MKRGRGRPRKHSLNSNLSNTQLSNVDEGENFSISFIENFYFYFCKFIFFDLGVCFGLRMQFVNILRIMMDFNGKNRIIRKFKKVRIKLLK